MDKSKTTDKIKSTLGASYTIAEIESAISLLQEEIKKQAPYFNGRELERLERLKESLK